LVAAVHVTVGSACIADASTPVRSAPDMFAPVRFVHPRSAPASFASERSARSSDSPDRFAPARSAPLRSISTKSRRPCAIADLRPAAFEAPPPFLIFAASAIAASCPDGSTIAKIAAMTRP
jgi:hypothetical protein